jgi:heptosyltransferase-2
VGRSLKRHGFVASFTPHRSFRSALLSYTAGAVRRYGFDRNMGPWFYTNRVRYSRSDHEIIRNLKLVRHHWRDEDQTMILPTLNVVTTPSDRIILAPGSVWPTKRWPEMKWVDLIKHPYLAKREIVLIGAESDRPVSEKIIAGLRGCDRAVEDRVGKDDLTTTFNVIGSSRMLISNDSGAQHFALALRTPVIAIFGSTIPEFGFCPVGKHDQIIQPPVELDCRPCGIHGRRECPIGTFDCMGSIEVSTVIQGIRRIDGGLRD